MSVETFLFNHFCLTISERYIDQHQLLSLILYKLYSMYGLYRFVHTHA